MANIGVDLVKLQIRELLGPDPTPLDIVLTRPKCPIFAVSWLRVVLEESHAIRNDDTANFLAATALEAYLRFITSGTLFANEYLSIILKYGPRCPRKRHKRESREEHQN